MTRFMAKSAHTSESKNNVGVIGNNPSWVRGRQKNAQGDILLIQCRTMEHARGIKHPERNPRLGYLQQFVNLIMRTHIFISHYNPKVISCGSCSLSVLSQHIFLQCMPCVCTVIGIWMAAWTLHRYFLNRMDQTSGTKHSVIQGVRTGGGGGTVIL